MYTVIAVDIGNTWVHCVKHKGNKQVLLQRLPTRKVTIQQLKKVFLSYPSAWRIVVCSVVPKITALVMEIKESDDRCQDISIVGKDIQVPIVSLYNKKKVGMDRLVAVFAARSFYDNTRFVLDFGTAVTFDVLSEKGDYMGGFILPGVGSTLRVLSGCALLPKKIVLRPGGYKVNSGKIPVDTQESIQRGVQEGFVLLVNAWVHKYSKILKIPLRNKVVITGGDAIHLLQYFDFPFIYEPFLVSKGLAALT